VFTVTFIVRFSVLLVQTKSENDTFSPGSLSVHTIIFNTEMGTRP